MNNLARRIKANVLHLLGKIAEGTALSAALAHITELVVTFLVSSIWHTPHITYLKKIDSFRSAKSASFGRNSYGRLDLVPC